MPEWFDIMSTNNIHTQNTSTLAPEDDSSFPPWLIGVLAVTIFMVIIFIGLIVYVCMRTRRQSRNIDSKTKPADNVELAYGVNGRVTESTDKDNTLCDGTFSTETNQQCDSEENEKQQQGNGHIMTGSATDEAEDEDENKKCEDDQNKTRELTVTVISNQLTPPAMQVDNDYVIDLDGIKKESECLRLATSDNDDLTRVTSDCDDVEDITKAQTLPMRPPMCMEWTTPTNTPESTTINTAEGSTSDNRGECTTLVNTMENVADNTAESKTTTNIAHDDTDKQVLELNTSANVNSDEAPSDGRPKTPPPKDGSTDL